jgi:hypothetical protein
MRVLLGLLWLLRLLNMGWILGLRWRRLLLLLWLRTGDLLSMRLRRRQRLSRSRRMILQRLLLQLLLSLLLLLLALSL